VVPSDQAALPTANVGPTTTPNLPANALTPPTRNPTVPASAAAPGDHHLAHRIAEGFLAASLVLLVIAWLAFTPPSRAATDPAPPRRRH
jgi:hypothetical protein